ncbi:hypothetical protein [Alkalihalobacterium sp. APHAB7]|uniref:hypothetical protein n=1 Tax=Alkalihalobacterium sp. APHAB7 TaxID=3402081 RepID=UPI003AAFFD24
MKRLITTLLLAGVVLTGCGGNPLGLDEERLQEGVVERAMKAAAVKNGDYTEDDIEVVEVCAAVRVGEEAFGHEGYYGVTWQTADGENRFEDRMDENYEVGGALNGYMIYEEIGCHNFKE